MPNRCLALIAILALLSGCGDRDTNPIGQELVDRTQGRLVSLPPLPAVDARSDFEAAFVGTGGLESVLLVGRTSGLIVRAALRFRLPIDSLAAAAGGSGPDDLTLAGVRVELRREPDLERLSGELSVEQPDFDWDELSAFVDTVQFVEREVPSSPIPGVAVAALGDTAYSIEVPTDYARSSVLADPDSAALSLLLLPAPGEEFLTALVSRNQILPDPLGWRPRLVVSYSVGEAASQFEAVGVADTYWIARDPGGLPTDALVLSGIVRLIPTMRFVIPDSIPEDATIIASKLTVDVDYDRSLFTSFPFAVDRVDLDEATGDSVDTRVNTWVFEGDTESFNLSQTLIQSWISGDVPNHGIRLKPRVLTVPEWVNLRNPRLEIIYGLPPVQADD